MRTDVKIGIALGAIILIVAGSYYGTKKRPDIQLSESGDDIREQNARTLKELLAPAPQVAQADSQRTAEPTEDHQPWRGARERPQDREGVVSKPKSPQVEAGLMQRTLQASKRLPPVPPPRERSSHGQSRQPTDPLVGTSDVDPAEQAPELPPASQGRIRAGETVGGSGAKRPPAQRRQETPVRIVKPPKQKLRTHVIQPGDNFSLLAQRYYGNQEYVGFLLAANHNVDPRRMKVGSTVRIPPLPTNDADAARSQPGFRKTGERLHEVREGESLFAIAEDHLGSGARWREVYELNKARIGADPAALRVGLILKLPAS